MLPALAKEVVDEALTILARPDSHLFDFADDAYWVYLTGYRVLSATEVERAPEILAYAYKILQRQAGMIPDQGLRRTFLEQMASHRALLNLWGAEQPDSSDAPFNGTQTNRNARRLR